MKVCTVGLGYIGLPTAAMLASRGHEVVGLDVNARVVDMINAGQAHFQEPDLQMLLSAAVETGRLRATTIPEPAEFFIIAVPTPMVNQGPDMSFVEAAARTIAPVLAKGNVVILESTSPVGSTERLAEIFAEERPDLTFPRDRDEESKGGQERDRISRGLRLTAFLFVSRTAPRNEGDDPSCDHRRPDHKYDWPQDGPSKHTHQHEYANEHHCRRDCDAGGPRPLLPCAHSLGERGGNSGRRIGSADDRGGQRSLSLADPAIGDVTRERESSDQHHYQPQLERVPCPVRPEALIREEWQHSTGDCCKIGQRVNVAAA